MNDWNASEFLPKDTRLKGDLLESTGWDGHPVTICGLGKKTYDASDDRAAETKLQVFFRELGDYAMECNSRQLKKLIELFGEHTGAWIGQQVILISTDAGIFKGVPTKTITVKEVRPVGAMPATIAPPPPAQRPAPAVSSMSLSEIPVDNDPFSNDPQTEEQYQEILTLCQQQGRNAVNTSQRLYAVNPDKLTFEQANDFIVQLKREGAIPAGVESRQTVNAMTR
jgi:hypothetical protein